jgi:hypothetical protein
VTVNLVAPGSLYGERMNQLDFRVSRGFQIGRVRPTLNFDLYNALNSSSVLTLNNNFAVWQRPTSILTARFFKVSTLVSF